MGNGLYDLRKDKKGNDLNYSILPLTAYKVKAIIGDTAATFIEGKDIPLANMQFFSHRINALEKLKETLRAQEDLFYHRCKVDNITQLNQKLQKINEANLSFSVDEIYSRMMQDPVVQASLSDMSAEGINAALNKIDWGILPEGEDLTSYAIQVVNNHLQSRGLRFIDTTREHIGGIFDTNEALKGKNQTSFGFRSTFEVTKDKHNKIHISVKEGASGSRKILDKMLYAIQDVNKGRADKVIADVNEFRDYFWRKLIEYMEQKNAANSRILFRRYLNEEIQKADTYRKGEDMLYDLNRSDSKIKGVIQEVWVNALLRSLTGTQATPTGNIKNDLFSKTEIGIDSVLENFKFQTKKYTLDSNSHYQIRESGKEATTLLSKQRGSLGDLMLQFFGSYQYNQPVTDDSFDSSDVEDYAANIYSKFGTYINSGKLDKAFQANMDYIMRIENYIRSDSSDIFKNEGYYQNTFFVVNDRFIPASLMIQCIINELYETESQSIMHFHLTDAKTDSSPTFQNDWSAKHDFDKASVTAEQAAQKVKIGYTIDLDFTRILNTAYIKAEDRANANEK